MDKTFRFDFDLDAWIKNVEIDAETEEEALEKLYKTLQYALDTLSETSDLYGCQVKDFNIKDVDTEIISASYKVKLSGIHWDVDEEDVEGDLDPYSETYEQDVEKRIEEVKKSLPTEYEVIVKYSTEDVAAEDAISIASDEVGWLIDSVDYVELKML